VAGEVDRPRLTTPRIGSRPVTRAGEVGDQRPARRPDQRARSVTAERVAISQVSLKKTTERRTARPGRVRGRAIEHIRYVVAGEVPQPPVGDPGTHDRPRQGTSSSQVCWAARKGTTSPLTRT